MSSQEFKENTKLVDKLFPFNLFHFENRTQNILYLHWHDNIEIIYMLGGHSIFNIGTQEIEASPGDVLFVNSGYLHSGYSVDNAEVEFYAIVLNKGLLSNQIPDPSYMKYIAPFLTDELLFPCKISTTEQCNGQIKGILDSIICEFNLKQSGYEIAVKSYLYLLFLAVFRNYSNTTESDVKQARYTRDVERFKELFIYIEKNYTEKITVDEAASIINLSPHHFCKTFKKITGRTFIEFLNLYRVNVAEELLRKTSLPITEISEKVGFCNINYFDKTFKQYRRYSPSMCRKT